MRSIQMWVYAIVASSLLAGDAVAQTTPRARAHHSIFYDAASKRVLLSGGSTPVDGGKSFQFFDDLWAFDGKHWTALPSSGEKLSGVGVAYDSRRGVVTSFGGYNGTTSVGALRVMENGAWKNVGERSGLPAAEAGFVYDSTRNRFVVFGGSSGPGDSQGDTWEYDGSNWAKLDASGPPARQAHAMVFDSKRGRVVVFGGMGSAPRFSTPPMLGDTWEFDGNAWRKVEVAGPSPRSAPGIAYDSKRGVTILFGGMGADGFNGDTWSWNGREWKLLSTEGPEPRAMGFITYDQARDRIVLFGGRKGYPNGDLGDTWEWDGTRWQRIGD